MNIASEVVLRYPCRKCYALPGYRCEGVELHRERIVDATTIDPFFNGFGDKLTLDQKNLIVYYAFIMLCDSCEMKSEKLFGARKVFTSQEIQQFFAAEAVKALRRDGIVE